MISRGTEVARYMDTLHFLSGNLTLLDLIQISSNEDQSNADDVFKKINNLRLQKEFEIIPHYSNF